MERLLVVCYKSFRGFLDTDVRKHNFVQSLKKWLCNTDLYILQYSLSEYKEFVRENNSFRVTFMFYVKSEVKQKWNMLAVVQVRKKAYIYLQEC